jgi:hypothetical protein
VPEIGLAPHAGLGSPRPHLRGTGLTPSRCTFRLSTPSRASTLWPIPSRSRMSTRRQCPPTSAPGLGPPSRIRAGTGPTPPTPAPGPRMATRQVPCGGASAMPRQLLLARPSSRSAPHGAAAIGLSLTAKAAVGRDGVRMRRRRARRHTRGHGTSHSSARAQIRFTCAHTRKGTHARTHARTRARAHTHTCAGVGRRDARCARRAALPRARVAVPPSALVLTGYSLGTHGVLVAVPPSALRLCAWGAHTVRDDRYSWRTHCLLTGDREVLVGCSGVVAGYSKVANRVLERYSRVSLCAYLFILDCFLLVRETRAPVGQERFHV